MKALICNCSHGSEIYLLEELSPEGLPVSILKSSSFKNGMIDLRRELAGFHWYNNQIGYPITINVFKESIHYIAIRYSYIRGRKVSYRNGYFKNRKWIAIIIEHYCSVWSSYTKSEGSTVLHGDLTIDNVIFDNENPIIIDWEHFNEHAAPLGFDGLNLLFESLWFESGNKSPRRNSLYHLADMINLMLARNCLGEEFRESTLFNFINFIKNNFSLWGHQISIFPKKLPVLLFNEQRIKSIDQELERIRRA